MFHNDELPSVLLDYEKEKEQSDEQHICLGYKVSTSKKNFIPENILYNVFCPIGNKIKCRVVRKKSENFSEEIFNLYVETKERYGVFMLCAMKKKRAFGFDLVISEERNSSPFFLKKKCATIIQKKNNIFSFYDDKEYIGSACYLNKDNRPKRLSVAIPSIKKNQKMFCFENKEPVWCNEENSFILDFEGRVTVSSIKNIQIISKQDPLNIILQFGKRGKDDFILDFKYPFTTIQAFSVMLCIFL